MGFETKRFKESDLKAQYLCPICRDVLEDPLQRLDCEHYFCGRCINDWLGMDSTCPIDRQKLTRSDLKDLPRPFKCLLLDLDIKCGFASEGCPAIVKLYRIEVHTKECEFNLEAVIDCENGCGCRFKRREKSSHCCLKYLKEIIADLEQNQKNLMTVIESESEMMRTEIEDLQQKLKQREQKRGLYFDPNAVFERVNCVLESIERQTSFRSKAEIIKLAPRFHSWAPYIRDGAQICINDGVTSPHEWVFLALMSGPTGRVTVVRNSRALEVMDHYAYLVVWDRIKFVEGLEGQVWGAPYDVIEMKLASIESQPLTRLLKVGGYLFTFSTIREKEEDGSFSVLC